MAKAKFDIKTEATRPFYAGVGVTDLAVEAVRDYVTDVQKTVKDLDFEPRALRAAVEARVAGLQAEAKGLVDESVDTASSVYGDLVKRGETLVERIRRQESTKATKRNAKTTSSKAKTTKTQGAKASKSTAQATKSSAKRTASTAKKSAANTSTAPKSSAKATGTAAKKTATAAASATTDAAAKVGD